MSKNNIAIAEGYYAAMGEKNRDGMAKYLHPNVQFIGSLAEMVGREAVLDAAVKFAAEFKGITIRAKFSAGDQVMLAYDFDFPPPIGKFRAAGLFNIQDGLITKIELFYDALPLVTKKEEIFSKR